MISAYCGLYQCLCTLFSPIYKILIHPCVCSRYDPWDQRLCVVPDSDMFHALKKDANGDCKASIITDKIVKFVEGGIVLENTHDVLECDVIITATGLQLKLCGGVEVFVDNEKVDFSKEVMYKGVLISVSV